MAEEKFFSIEKTLLDFLWFLKKMGSTVFYCFIRPDKIIKNSFNLAKEPDPDKAYTPYTNYFVYFVISVLIAMSLYRSILYNSIHHIFQSIWEVILSGKDYLLYTSALEKLIPCLLFILVNYLIIKMMAELLVRGRSTTQKRTLKFVFRNVCHYFQGTIFLVWLVPYLLKNVLPFSEKGMTNFFIWGYICVWAILFSVQLYKRTAHWGARLFFTTIPTVALVFILAFLPIAEKALFKWYMESMGYLQYIPKVKLSDAGGGKAAELRINKTDSSFSFYFYLQVENDNGTNIILDRDTSLHLYLPLKNNRTDTIIMGAHEALSDTLPTKSVNIDPSRLRLLYFRSAKLSETVLTDLYSLQKNKDSLVIAEAQLYYLPGERSKRARQITVRVVGETPSP